MTVRDLDPMVKAKLRERAARRGRSMEAEVRQILAEAVNADEGRPSLVDSVFRHFRDIEVEMEYPDRSESLQRDVEL